MKRTLNTLAILAGACAAHAISFSSISIVDPLSNGSANNSGFTSFGPNGLEFGLPALNALLEGTIRKINISFHVDATAGFELSSMNFNVIGRLRHATATMKFTHTPGPQILSSTQMETAGNFQDLTGGGMAFAPASSFFDVFVELTLENHTSHPPFAQIPVSKLTDLSIVYHESPVPEPASIATIGLGIGSLLLRRNKRR